MPDEHMSTTDHALDRFVAAQEGVHETALAELRAGCKRTHWMWFVFPQIAGLGHSAMAQRYAIASLDEAHAYAAHPVLGARLRDAARAASESPAGTAEELMGGIDALKLRSSMTLFAVADPKEPTFRAVLDRYFGGEEDSATLDLLG